MMTLIIAGRIDKPPRFQLIICTIIGASRSFCFPKVRAASIVLFFLLLGGFFPPVSFAHLFFFGGE